MENNVKAKRRVIAILSTVIALCVIIGIVLLILHIRNNTDGRSLVGTDTTENYLNQQQSSETEEMCIRDRLLMNVSRETFALRESIRLFIQFSVTCL